MSYLLKPGIPGRYQITGSNATMIPTPAQLTGVTMTTAAAANLNVDLTLAAGVTINDSDIAIGDYLWDNTGFEGREITWVSVDKTSLRIKTAFSAKQTAANVYVVKNRKYREVSIRSSGTASTVDSVVTDPDFPFTFEDHMGLVPIHADPNGDTMTVNTKE